MTPTPTQEGPFKRDVVLVARLLVRLSALVEKRGDIGDLLDRSPAPRGCERVAVPQQRLDYSDVEETAFVRAMWRVYEYAAKGIQTVGERPRFPSSTHRTAASAVRILADAARSEWLFDSGSSASIARCQQLCEIAHARLLLEGLPALLCSVWPDSRREDDRPPVLSVGQLAMLAGLDAYVVAEELRRGRIQRHVKGSGCEAVAVGDAKTWLLRKGL